MTAVQAFKKYLWIFVKYFSVIFLIHRAASDCFLRDHGAENKD